MEEEIWIECKLITKAYIPLNLEKDMYFKTLDGVVWQLQENILPKMKESFIQKHGPPVELHVIYDGDIITEPEEIGLIDTGEDYYKTITLAQINLILKEYDGMVDVKMTETEETLIPEIIQENIVFRICLENIEEYEFEEI